MARIVKYIAAQGQELGSALEQVNRELGRGWLLADVLPPSETGGTGWCWVLMLTSDEEEE